MGMSLLRS
ncbi:hypothetical protein CMUS01_02878 [Colletotrichum musicola]|uniref:Uncharacterized protein n=1 Tax=Colletotrichum musicola TaxID=2175873 RepID=A0A8H6NU17_9PEZI|nr:hypothetical protein CMUS01_02878 [Colletotrichum musicola]